MSIVLYESRHLTEAGFFRYLFRSLRSCGARVEEKPPFPKEETGGRHHEGAWVRIQGSLCFFDMSDHIFDFDGIGLREADLYFKANLNREVARRALEKKECVSAEEKLRSFTFLPPSLSAATKIGALATRRFIPGPDLFHVVGVYENPIKAGVSDPFATPGSMLEPHVMHFWVRYHFSKAIQKTQLSAVSRLTSRGNREIEDGVTVKSNLNHHLFLLRIASSKFTVLNTFPHAVYPWKALESLAIGRPFIVEREPLIEIPEAFRPVSGTHFLEVLPGFGSFDLNAPLEDPSAYRVLEVPSVDAIREGFQRVSSILDDRDRVKAMSMECRRFAQERLNPRFVVQWLKEEVGRSA